MTGPYEWNPMPRALAVRCSKCEQQARFEFVTAALLGDAKCHGYFKKSSMFELLSVRDHQGQMRHMAIYYPGLHGETLHGIRDLPAGFSPSDWDPDENPNSRWFMASQRDRGTVVCENCAGRYKHQLTWPDDAFYQLDHRGQILWAFNNESATELRDYIASEERDRHQYRYGLFLMKVPGTFLTKKARSPVVKKLDELLATHGVRK